MRRFGQASYKARGSALILAVLAVFAAALAMVTLSFALDDGPVADPAGAHRSDEAQLMAARDRVLAWYGQHLAELDSVDPFPWATGAVLRAVDLDQVPALRLAAGPRNDATAAGGLRWRGLALWLSPGADDRSGFDSSGRFQPDPRVRASVTFASEALQRDAYAASEQRLRALATLAELRYVAKLRADPAHDVGRNWFRAVDCAHPSDDELPCSVAGAPQAVSSLLAATEAFGTAMKRPADLPSAQQPDALGINAWGAPNLFDNTPDAVNQPPFSMRFSTATPFATTIGVVAVEPLE